MTPDLPAPYDFTAEADTWAWFEECDDGEYASAPERRATLPAELWAALDGMVGFDPSNDSMKQDPTHEAAEDALGRAPATVGVTADLVALVTVET
jgi:hypothetical protein